MSATRDPALLERIARVLAGSADDGKALNAARLADRLVHEGGLTWHDIISPSANVRQLPERNPTWCATVADSLCWADSLRPWERRLLETPTRFPGLSPKQRIVTEIADRVLGEHAT